MAKLIDDQEQEGSSGGGAEQGPTTPVTPPAGGQGPLDPGRDLGIPIAKYRQQRYTNSLLFGPPAETKIVSEAAVGTNVVNASYRWQGYQAFSAEPIKFTIRGDDAFRLLIGDQLVIDQAGTGLGRVKSAIVDMPAGESLLIVEWQKYGGGTKSVRMNWDKATPGWVSCEDGVRRPGDPPDGWIQTETSCWRPPTPEEMDLAGIVQISPSSPIEVGYALRSGAQAPPVVVMFYNRATNLSVNVQLDGPAAAAFSEAAFELMPQETREVTVTFPPAELDQLAEGTSTSAIAVVLSQGSLAPDEDAKIGPPVEPPEEPIVIPPPDAPTPPPLQTWCDASGPEVVTRPGTPPEDWTQRADGCYVPPASTTPSVTLAATFAETAPKLLDGVSIAQGSLAASISGDDPNLWSWAWDLDVLGQGSGTGDTAARSLLARWVMTQADLQELETAGAASRLVEVVARKGTDVLRKRIKAVLDDPALALVTSPTQPSSLLKTTVIKNIPN